MSNDRQLNYVNDLQNRDQKLYYVDDASELNSINLEENDKIYAINDNKLFQMEIADQEEELSGSIVSFNGRNNTKIKSLIVNIEPVQDLHGYDHPWPASGGVNQWDEQWEVGGIENATGLPFNTLDRIRSKNYSPCLASTNYYGVAPSPYLSIFWYTSNNEFISLESASNKVLISPATAAYFKVVLANNVTTYGNNIAINYPSTVITYSPYSNICPISGWTGTEIEHRGKNFVDSALYEFTERTHNGLTYTVQNDGTIKVNGTPSSAGGPGLTKRFLLPPGTYAYFEAKEQGVFCTYRYAMQQNGGNTYSLHSPFRSTGKEWLYVNLYCEQIKKYDNVILYPQVELGSTITDYVPYTDNQVSVTFPTTVYGGEDEVISGKLKSTMGMVDMGTLTWYYSSGRMIARIGDIKSPASNFTKANVICSMYPITTSANTEDPNYDKYLGVSRYGDICVRDSSYTDVTIFKTAMLGVQLCYELAEPVEYILTPQPMTTLYGTNNIWSDIGDITVKIAEKGITAFELAPHT